jgi:hypothetical protein
MGVRTRRNQIIIALGGTSVVASKPKPRGLVEHVISLEGQPDRIAGPVVAAARGLGVDLVLSDGDGQECRVPRGKRYALGDVSLQPVGPRLAGHLHVLWAHADPRLRKRLPVGHPATVRLIGGAPGLMFRNAATKVFLGAS